MNGGVIDSHCHLDFEPLASRLKQVCADAAAAGVTRMVVPGVHPDGWARIADIAAIHPQVVPAYGIHPMHAACASPDVFGRLEEYAAGGSAIGEIGLDPLYPVAMELQEQTFREQLRIAVRRGLPVLIHCRRQFQRLLALMREERVDQVGGIMHAFSGSVETARECIRLGCAVAVSGTVTWRSAVKPLRLAAELPLEWLVLETDAPDLSPEPYRGRSNRPAWIRETLQRVADIRGCTPHEVAVATSATASRILRLESYPGSGQ